MMRVSLRLSYNYYRIISSANSLALDLVLRTVTKNEEQGWTVPLGTPEITASQFGVMRSSIKNPICSLWVGSAAGC